MDFERPPTLHLTQSTHPPSLPPVAHRVHIHIEIDLNLFSRLHLTNQPSETSRTNQITSNRIQPTITTTGEKKKKSGPRRKPHFSNMAFLAEEEKRVLFSRGNRDFPLVGCLFVEYKLRRLHSIIFLYFSSFPPSPKTLSPTSYMQSGEFVCYALGPDRLHLLSGAATDPPSSLRHLHRRHLSLPSHTHSRTSIFLTTSFATFQLDRSLSHTPLTSHLTFFITMFTNCDEIILKETNIRSIEKRRDFAFSHPSLAASLLAQSVGSFSRARAEKQGGKIPVITT